MSRKKKRPLGKLANGRPPTATRVQSITRKATRSLINKHHLLEKRKQQAISNGDRAGELAAAAEIEALGGIQKYQQASLQGQREDRGGDSSKILMKWFETACIVPGTSNHKKLRMLEVGALRTDNACSESGLFHIERIDLNSQGEGILQQDFMKRPQPRDVTETFDIISLSLVLNFVPEPAARGDMLRRTLDFLPKVVEYQSETLRSIFPALFLVLPAPCVNNSRYLDQHRLTDIMNSLGYSIIEVRETQRLVYYLWKLVGSKPETTRAFTKKEVRSGSSRNNFAIVLKD